MIQMQDEQVPPDSDRERQIFVTLSTVFALVSAMVGLGLLGSPVDVVASGALASDATLVAPAQWAFLLWRPIYLGMLAYAVLQWLPGQRTRPLHREIGWQAGWSMILAGAWVLVTQRGWLWIGVLFLFAIVFVLALVNLTLASGAVERRRAGSWLAVDATFGVYLGWASIATIAMVTATLKSVYITYGNLDPLVAVIVLLIGAGVGVRLALHTKASLTILFGFVWGFVAIAWGRLAGPLESPFVAGGAILAAVVVTGGTLAVGWAGRRSAAGMVVAE